MPKLLMVHEVTALDMADLQDQGDSLSSSSQTQTASLRRNGQDTSPLGVPNPPSSRNHADVQTHEIEKVTDYQEPTIGPDNHLDRTRGGRAAPVLHLSQDLK